MLRPGHYVVTDWAMGVEVEVVAARYLDRLDCSSRAVDVSNSAMVASRYSDRNREWVTRAACQTRSVWAFSPANHQRRKRTCDEVRSRPYAGGNASGSWYPSILGTCDVAYPPHRNRWKHERQSAMPCDQAMDDHQERATPLPARDEPHWP